MFRFSAFTFSHFFIGLTMVAIGVIGVKFTFQIVNLTGPQDWLERFTGPGSTYGIFKIFGVLLAIAGLIFATGYGWELMNFLFSPLKGLFGGLSQK